MKRVAFRTKGNNMQGMGDILGSLSLAQEFSSRSYDVIFIIDNNKEAIEAVKSAGYKFLTNGKKTETKLWLELPLLDIVIVNQLNTPRGVLETIKRHCNKLVTIDDTGEASRELASLRINSLYNDKKAVCEPKYIPLHKAFRKSHLREKKIKTRAENLLISLGGSDTYGLTPDLLTIISNANTNLNITVIIGPAFKHYKKLKKAMSSITGKIKALYSLSAKRICNCMMKADGIICSGGNTMFEAASLGLPALVICGEPFEEESAFRMQGLGTCLAMPFSKILNRDLILSKLKELLLYKNRFQFSRKGKKLIDARGAFLLYKLIKQSCLM